MTLRNSSGKFSLPSFARRNTAGEPPSSPSHTNGTGVYDDDGNSPGRERDSSGGGVGGGFDGFGRKLGKSIAHQSLLPGLGNRDLRALQDVISSEKSVLQATEKLAIESSKSAAALPAYGALEGPDLQDVLTHSSTLLQHLSAAFNVFIDHQSAMRGCYKRIRQREEALDELRRRRRATGAKSENAEKKLAKMGPENKGLPQQTDLLERLRLEMRQMDTDIVAEESKIGDFKRQIMKEALSLKFGGLEELGEKMCIIGELGKLLLVEIPLEETPPSYSRARYTGYDKTENAVNEATKCLATVRFQGANDAPRAPDALHQAPTDTFNAQSLSSPSNIAAAEEFANYPANAASPPTAIPKGKGRDFSLDDSDPYGGITHNPYRDGGHADGDYGGMRAAGSDHVVWQGPGEDDSQGNGHEDGEDLDEPAANNPDVVAHDHEYDQPRQLVAERAESAPEQQLAVDTNDTLPNTHEQDVVDNDASTPYDEMRSPWEPLNLRRDHTATPEHTILRDANLGPPISMPTTDTDQPLQQSHPITSPTSIELPPPPTSFHDLQPAQTPGGDGQFYTPMEGPSMSLPDHLPVETRPATQPASFAPVALGGKISAAAFRRAAKPQASLDLEDSGSSLSPMTRRLPVPPGRPETPVGATVALPASPSIADEDHRFEARHALGRRVDNDAEIHAEARKERSPPPSYANDSLR